MKPLCIVVGFGTDVVLGITHAFGEAGFQLGLISRNPAKYSDTLQDLGQMHMTVNLISKLQPIQSPYQCYRCSIVNEQS
jgi:hypothetical protein